MASKARHVWTNQDVSRQAQRQPVHTPACWAHWETHPSHKVQVDDKPVQQLWVVAVHMAGSTPFAMLVVGERQTGMPLTQASRLCMAPGLLTLEMLARAGLMRSDSSKASIASLSRLSIKLQGHNCSTAISLNKGQYHGRNNQMRTPSLC
jgi:hypothetical protein